MSPIRRGKARSGLLSSSPLFDANVPNVISPTLFYQPQNPSGGLEMNQDLKTDVRDTVPEPTTPPGLLLAPFVRAHDPVLERYGVL